MNNLINRRERKKLHVKNSISGIALKLFFEKGFMETTVAEIMEEADLGTGTFYNYFSSKEEILKHCLAEKIIEARESLEDIQQSSVKASLKLSKMLFTAGKTFEENRQLIELYTQFHRDNNHAKRQSPHGPRFKEILVSIIREGQGKREFREDIPLEIIIEMYMGILKSTMSSSLEISFMDNLKYKFALLLEGINNKNER
ncbi:transcriptional regulator [Desulfocucumis palustris]|uniref:Transcriptional regulator n=1 Tax=Desulfocucumis palustris TaxID=1898651 RepID=A0A2L2XIX3_9FIRM|nr:TetR/AcrR family transcriptional regulator [Desulfocucumis palustris]GBF33871.1 transcriptional regulator [Desulfocucumis palustris]